MENTERAKAPFEKGKQKEEEFFWNKKNIKYCNRSS